MASDPFADATPAEIERVLEMLEQDGEEATPEAVEDYLEMVRHDPVFYGALAPPGRWGRADGVYGDMGSDRPQDLSSSASASSGLATENTEEGGEYVMSGGLHHAGVPVPSSPNDGTVCVEDINTAVQHMPFKPLRNRDIAELSPALFRDASYVREIPGDWLTTVWGVFRAQQECAGLPGGVWTDEDMLGSLAKRGGFLSEEGKAKAVWYVEDIVARVPRESRFYDREYWEELARQGGVWGAMGMDEEGDGRGCG